MRDFLKDFTSPFIFETFNFVKTVVTHTNEIANFIVCLESGTLSNIESPILHPKWTFAKK